MTSVKRIKDYSSLEQEPLKIGQLKLTDNQWPKHGEIQFENVSFSYAKNLPQVLNELSFRIAPGEKVGIVGRTGAGKSSIIQAMFRMGVIAGQGRILIDGIDIKQLSLHDLRSKLSIIPVIYLFIAALNWK